MLFKMLFACSIGYISQPNGMGSLTVKVFFLGTVYILINSKFVFLNEDKLSLNSRGYRLVKVK